MRLAWSLFVMCPFVGAGCCGASAGGAPAATPASSAPPTASPSPAPSVSPVSAAASQLGGGALPGLLGGRGCTHHGRKEAPSRARAELPAGTGGGAARA